MASVNKVIIVGNLGADPEVRSFQNGGQVCNLRIATSETWKDRDGQRQERTEWHSVSIFAEGLIGIAEQYLRKGSKVYIEGKLQTRKWQDQHGNDRYSTEIVLQPYSGTLVMLDRPADGDRGSQGGSRGSGGRGGSGRSQGGSTDRRGTQQTSMNTEPDPASGWDDLDDDIPF